MDDYKNIFYLILLIVTLIRLFFKFVDWSSGINATTIEVTGIIFSKEIILKKYGDQRYNIFFISLIENNATNKHHRIKVTQREYDAVVKGSEIKISYLDNNDKDIIGMTVLKL